MTSADEDQELVFSPSEADKFILQRTSNSSRTMNTLVNKGSMSSVTAPGLVSNKTLCDLNAKIEELQQEAVRVKSLMISRDTYVEKRFRDQEERSTLSSARAASLAKPLAVLPS